MLTRRVIGHEPADLPAAKKAALPDHLGELLAAGLVTRTQYDQIPVRAGYDLPDEGHGLCNRLESLLK